MTAAQQVVGGLQQAHLGVRRHSTCMTSTIYADAAEQGAPVHRPVSVPALRLEGITKRFGDVEAVRGVNLVVEPGEIVAFLGPNGAGKTSTLDIVLGLSRPTSGVVEVLGMTPHAAIARGLVSAVMQTGGLLKDLTVREPVAYTASLFGRAGAVDDVLTRAGIAHLAGRLVGKCSGGEQQRLRFALALVPDPALLLLDEPTTGMDVEGRHGFWREIRQDAARGRTVLFATHYLEEADANADRVVLLSRGLIVADGSAGEVKALAAGRTVRATITDPDSAALGALPGVDAVEAQGETVRIHTRDSDGVARYLLTRTNARDIEITARGLEDAFLALTGAPEEQASS